MKTNLHLRPWTLLKAILTDISLSDKNHEILVDLLPDVVSGYVFWSFFCTFGSSIWFYPLNALDVTGYEAFLAVLLIPIVYVLTPVQHLLQTKIAIVLMCIVQFGCLFVHKFPTTLDRLVVMAIGTGISLLLLMANLWSRSALRRFTTAWGLILGYMLMLAARIYCRSLLPTWALEEGNVIVVTFAAVALLNRLISSDVDSETVEKHKTSVSTNVVMGVGFGTLLYMTQSMYGEVSVMLRWIETEQPSWLSPNPWGFSVFAALMAGLLLGMAKTTTKTNVIYGTWFSGTCGLMLLYFQLSVAISLIGGLVFGFFLMSLWPIVLDNFSKGSPGSTFTIAMITYMVEILFSIWTIAYNFVPGGVYTRELTSVLLVAASCIFLVTSRIVRRAKGSRSAFMNMSRTIQYTNNVPTIRFVLWWIFIFGAVGFWRRMPYSPPANYKLHLTEHSPPNRFSSLIWTYHFGFDNVGLPSFQRSAELLRQTGADVITLLESDASKPYLGNNDITQWMAEELNMYSDFGPSTKTHTWGNLLLSKFPIVKSKHHLLPSPFGELAPAIHATIDVRGQLVDFVTTHMGNDRDIIDRKLQAEFLSNLTRESKNPVVFMGYVTSAPRSRDYVQLTRSGKLKDIDETDHDRWCEYIMYRGLIRHGYARISRGDLSDTELQMATFEIPKDTKYDDNNVLVREDVGIPEHLQFNPIFLPSLNSNATKHRYHVDTPKYFVAALP